LARSWSQMMTGERLVLEKLDAEQLQALPAEDWRNLAQSALVENPFYARPHVLSGLSTIDHNKRLTAYTYRDDAGQLVGLFLSQPNAKVFVPFPVANSFANDYQFSGTPLVHRDFAQRVVSDWVADIVLGVVPAVWAFGDVDTASPLAQLMVKTSSAQSLHSQIAVPYERAHLTRLEGGFEAHLAQVLSKNRLKDVRRTMRRLGEAGAITLEHVEDDDAALAGRLEDFLTLEHSGWKGAAGTSFLSNPIHAGFARTAYVKGFAAIDSLLLDGKPIAMKLSIRQGETAFTPKIAYDEAYKKLGPGMALEYLLIEAFYGAETLRDVDAAASEDSHSALNFFNAQKSMGTLIIGRKRQTVWLLAALHNGRKLAKIKLKEWSALWQARMSKGTAKD
jgi:CelD/BcsL family acetyltransferase involved in cellulose biosynthesis